MYTENQYEMRAVSMVMGLIHETRIFMTSIQCIRMPV